jgi:hypothetical protein
MPMSEPLTVAPAMREGAQAVPALTARMGVPVPAGLASTFGTGRACPECSMASAPPGKMKIAATPAQAGVQVSSEGVDSRLRGNDRTTCGDLRHAFQQRAEDDLRKANVPNEAVNLLKTKICYFSTGLEAVNLLKTCILIDLKPSTY